MRAVSAACRFHELPVPEMISVTRHKRVSDAGRAELGPGGVADAASPD